MNPDEADQVPPDIRRALSWLVRELAGDSQPVGGRDPIPDQLLGMAILLTGTADRAQDALHSAAARLYLTTDDTDESPHRLAGVLLDELRALE